MGRAPSAIVLALVLVVVLAFCQTAKRGKGSLVMFSILRRFENRTRFARIGIKTKNQELGRQRSQIDGATHERFRIIPFHATVLAFVLGRFRKPLRLFEYEIDRLFDLIGQRLERDDAILSDRRGDRSDDMQTAVAAGDIEIGFKSRQVPKPRDFRNRSADVRIGDKVEMLAGLGNLLHPYQDVPWCGGIWRFGVGHRNRLRVGKSNSAAQ